MGKKTPKRKKLADVVPPDYRDIPYEQRAYEEAERLVDTYNECLAKTSAAEKRPKRAHVTQLQFFVAVARFARDHRVDPAAWIYMVFAQLGWTRVPPSAAFFQAKRLAVVAKVGRTQYAEISSMAVGATTRATDPAEGFVPFRDLSPGAEVAKRNYALRGRWDACILQADIHYGWHASSPSCATCPLAQRCRTQTEQLKREYDERQGDKRYRR